MERTVKLNLREEEEKLLESLVEVYGSNGIQRNSDNVLNSALSTGSRWDTFLYEKLAKHLFLMGGCSYEEYDKMLTTHKQQVENEYKAYQAEKSPQKASEEQVLNQSEAAMENDEFEIGDLEF